jgi:periplasmic copper chaperone A
MRRYRRLLAVAAVAVLALGASACGDDDDEATSTTTTASAQSEIVVADAWCRTSPAMATAGACYLTLTNDGDLDDALVAASVPSDIAATVELHETAEAESDGSMSDTTMSDDTSGDGMGDDSMSDDTPSGMMEMRQVSQIDLRAGDTVSLEPGGLHIMLLELPQPLTGGTDVALTLTFQTAAPQTVMAEVRSS